MNNRFEWIIKFVLDAEGGYDNDPDDPGGETKYGIDKRSHPDVNIKELTIEEAKDIYFTEYWVKFNCEQYAKPVGEVYFDCCVNTGAKQSNKFLQRAVGTNSDGIIGPKTLAAIHSADAYKLAFKVIDQRQTFYENLAYNKNGIKKYLNGASPMLKFLKGWTNRNIKLRNYIA
jgi:lysozyme family protein